MTSADRHKTVSFLSALVSVGIIDMEEFMSVLTMIDEAVVEEDNVSEGFLLKLSDLYRIMQDQSKR